MAEQIRVSPSQGEVEFISKAAQAWGRSKADIILDGYRRSALELMNEFEVWQRVQGVAPESDELRLLILRLATGEDVQIGEISEVAHDAGIPIDALVKIRDCLKKNGGREHVHVDR